MIILIIIYVISVIGAILTIRYDDYFDEDSYVLVIVFCPVVNSILSIIELLACIACNTEALNKKLYNLITCKKNNK